MANITLQTKYESILFISPLSEKLVRLIILWSSYVVSKVETRLYIAIQWINSIIMETRIRNIWPSVCPWSETSQFELCWSPFISIELSKFPARLKVLSRSLIISRCARLSFYTPEWLKIVFPTSPTILMSSLSHVIFTQT